MRKIENEMLNAINEKKEMKKANTSVIVTNNGVFVRLYNSLIYACIDGVEYYSNGGWDTVTTRSRLYALGFKKGGNLCSQSEMNNLMWHGRLLRATA